MKSKRPKPPKFNRKNVFNEVEKSNKRFNTYTKEERKEFAKYARSLRNKD